MNPTITRILVPTDFSATSEAALDYATAVASRFGASLHLLHVVDDPFIGGVFSSKAYITSVPAMRVQLVDEAAGKLSGLVRRCRSVAARSEVRVGQPADVIREAAEEHECDLIVMGTHGRTGIAHVLLGSVAERMVRDAPCPVLTVRGDAANLATGHPHSFDRDLASVEPRGSH